MKLGKKMSSNNHSKTRRRWTDAEIAFLNNNSGSYSAKQLGILFNRSSRNIATTVCNMGLKLRPPPNVWREDEINFLIKNFKDYTAEELGKKFNRTRAAIQAKLEKMGLIKNNCVDRKTKDPKHTNMLAKFSTYKHNAKRGNKTFNLNFEQFSMLIQDVCHYCGCDPEEANLYKSRTDVKNKTVRINSVKLNGVDRVVNSIGYEHNNCVTACNGCNIAKGTYTYDEFINRSCRIAKRHGK